MVFGLATMTLMDSFSCWGWLQQEASPWLRGQPSRCMDFVQVAGLGRSTFFFSAICVRISSVILIKRNDQPSSFAGFPGHLGYRKIRIQLTRSIYRRWDPEPRSRLAIISTRVLPTSVNSRLIRQSPHDLPPTAGGRLAPAVRGAHLWIGSDCLLGGLWLLSWTPIEICMTFREPQKSFLAPDTKSSWQE